MNKIFVGDDFLVGIGAIVEYEGAFESQTGHGREDKGLRCVETFHVFLVDPQGFGPADEILHAAVLIALGGVDVGSEGDKFAVLLLVGVAPGGYGATFGGPKAGV